MKHITIGLLCLWSCILASAEYHIKQDGSGDFTTIQQACDVAVAGDTVIIHAGVYREWAKPKNSGTTSNPITYRANAGDTVWIDGENTRISVFGPDPATHYNKIHHIILEDLGFRNGTSKSAAYFWTDGNWQQGMVTTGGGHHWTMRRCELTGSGNHAFDIGDMGGEWAIPWHDWNRETGFHLIENNFFHDNGGCHIIGMRSYFTRIIGNRFERSGGGDTHENGSVKFHHFIHGQMKYNFFGETAKRHIWLDHSNQASRIHGNVFVSSTGNSIYREGNLGPIYFDHNIFLGTGHQTRQAGIAVGINNLVVNTARLASSQTHSQTHLRRWEPGTWNFLGTHPLTGNWGRYYNNLYFNPNPNEHQWSTQIKGAKSGPDKFWNLAYTPHAAEVSNPNTSVFRDFNPNLTWEKNDDMFTIRFHVDSAIAQPANKIIDETICWSEYGGKMPDTNEVCPRMDTDISGKQWTNATIIPGPFSDLKVGLNEYTFVYGPRRGVDSNNTDPVVSQVVAHPDTVMGSTSSLSASASDADNDPLTYTWSVTSKPAGAGSPSFSVNGDASSSTTITFAQAGDYTFSVTVSDGRGGSASGVIDVTVGQTASDLTVE